jgi:uncharacterized membrane protein
VPTSRLEAFSDGVFAIAITVLVLGIAAPIKTDHLLARLLDLWPSYLGYVLSFLLIGLLWVNHHVMFEHVQRADRLLMFINTLLLLVVAFIPFSTAVLASTFRTGDGQPVAVALYGFVMTAAGLLFNWIWSHCFRAGLMSEAVTQRRYGRMTRRILFGPLVYLVGAVVGYFVPVLGVVLYLGLILFYWLPIRQTNEAGETVGTR